MAYLPAKGYIPGQDMPVTVEIENGSNVKVREVICELLKVSVSFLLFTYFFIHSLYFYSFDPATWDHSPKDVEHVKIHVT